MAYDEQLADRIRKILVDQPVIEEKNDGWRSFYG